MRSARQAWHDCFFIPNKDRCQMLQEAASPVKAGLMYRKVWLQDESKVDDEGKPLKYYVILPLMGAKQKGSYKGDFFSFWDPIWRAKVKRAIKGLNKTLQAFGMYMYAPQHEVNDDDTELVQEFIKTVFYQSVAPSDISNWKSKKPILIHFLAFTAMKYHRDMVFGGQSQLATPTGISNYMHGNFGERISEAHWARDWQDIWDKFRAIINEMERTALTPVSEILHNSEDQKNVIA